MTNHLEQLTTEVLVVGGGTGATAAAIQSARRGAKTLLVTEFPWLGGMLTSAGVAAPDGNELRSLQTGLWGQFLRALAQQQAGGLDHAWVSFFTYDPALGAAIFGQWVRELPGLTWRMGGEPQEVLRQGDRVVGVAFSQFTVQATMVVDGTELGDLLALGAVPHRWGWEPQEQWGEPSAPPAAALGGDPSYDRYPVQSPTWVVVLQDYGPGGIAPPITPSPLGHGSEHFSGAWERHGADRFLTYGQLPGHRLMINWPIRGNDYGEGVGRLVGSPGERHQFLQEALWHSQHFAHWIQTQIPQGQRYGLASSVFPLLPHTLGGGAFALHPYYRESRRVQGLVTVVEQDLLPQGSLAPLPQDAQGHITSIAVGNYANDHHYPDREIPLAPKSMVWGGRWTGTPFGLPYGCLVPEAVDGLLVCDKNISVSHMANGATRLQPLVMGLGQAAGMAAALCVERGCQPRDLPVGVLQEALITDPLAPAAVIPSLDLVPEHPHWLQTQRRILKDPDTYDAQCYHLDGAGVAQLQPDPAPTPWTIAGTLQPPNSSPYPFIPDVTPGLPPLDQPWILVTLCPWVAAILSQSHPGDRLQVHGFINPAEGWIRVQNLQTLA